MKLLRHLLVGLAGVTAAAWVYLYLPSEFASIEKRFWDFAFFLRGDMPSDGRIVIVDIDEKSLAELGQWPWSRNRVARILQNLSDAGAAVIGMDIVFAEADNTSPVTIADKIGLQLLPEQRIDYDRMLADAIGSTPTVSAFAFRFDDEGTHDELFFNMPMRFVETGRTAAGFLLEPRSTVPNIPSIQDASTSTGFFNVIADEDGVVRSVPLLLRYQDEVYPLLAFELFRRYRGISEVNIRFGTGGVASIDVGELSVPTDRYGRLAVNYRGGSHTHRYVSAADVFAGRFDAAAFQGSIVLLGTSAIGLFDVRSTPMDSAMPGVEVHANVIDNLLNADFISRPAWAESADLLFIVLPIMIIALVTGLLRGAWMVAGGVMIAAAVPLAGYAVFAVYGILISIVFPLLGVMLVFIASMILEYFLEIRKQAVLRDKLARKVSREVMEDILQHPEDNVLLASEREVTVFFSDIAGFTTRSEAIGSPMELLRQLNAFFEPMVAIIAEEKGTIDKFIGDAVMAYWNAPKNVPNHADRAVTAALRQIRELERFNAEFAKQGLPPFGMRIGINTGTATVGEVGSSGRSDYTIIGDCVNVASRLEGANKLYGSSIAISETTREALRGTYVIRDLDRIRLKGKTEYTHVYQVMDEGSGSERLQEELQHYHEALAQFRNGEYHAALAAFEALQRATGDMLYELYANRSRERMF